jgi:hypothetical protein
VPNTTLKEKEKKRAQGATYHLALDLGRIRRPVNKYDFVARIAIRCGVPKRGKGKTRRDGSEKKRHQHANRGGGWGAGELLEVIHAISAIILWQQSKKLGVCGILLSSCLQTNLSVLVVDLVDEETASVLQKI